MPSTPTLVISERFCGPPESANGGYVCALTAKGLDGPVEVTLRAPTPLGKPLHVDRGDRGAQLYDGDELIVEAVPASLRIEIPGAVSVDAAARASAQYPWRDQHPYPTCFVCGPSRSEGDGLRIFPGPVGSEPRFASTWLPDTALAGADGEIPAEYVWAALDCPSGIVTDLYDGVGELLLGRLTVDIRREVMSGLTHVIQAWPIRRDGRKLHTASALFTADGELCAIGRAVWIELATG